LNQSLKEIGTTPEIRMERLGRLIESKPIVKVMEAHNGLTGLIVENIATEVDGRRKEFDAMWLSSLTDSTAKGKPDIEAVDVTSRLHGLNDILEVTTKPIIYDGDTGGIPEHFVFTVKTLERLGVSAIIIEDKTGLKKNSLFGTDVAQTQDTIENFCHKISEGKKAQVTKSFMIIARIESLILNQGIDDAITRADAYIKAGADGVMIHSKEKNGDEIMEFCRRFKMLEKRVPLVAVPSSYNHIYEMQLIDAGVNVVIYANHLLRSAYPAMVDVAKSILTHERSLEADDKCMSIKEILNLIPGTK
jgi:phosphoenolpyruvate phosphomutase